MKIFYGELQDLTLYNLANYIHTIYHCVFIEICPVVSFKETTLTYSVFTICKIEIGYHKELKRKYLTYYCTALNEIIRIAEMRFPEIVEGTKFIEGSEKEKMYVSDTYNLPIINFSVQNFRADGK